MVRVLPRARSEEPETVLMLADMLTVQDAAGQIASAYPAGVTVAERCTIGNPLIQSQI